uniref:mannan endo-1,4-beta-mannosidase n=1 Tax=Anthurium amnicola TaxID=1678845 RepID=A0A1D1XIE5_9ARAE
MGRWWSSYPLLGVLLLAAFVYLNWFDGGGGDPSRLRIPIPWLQPRMGFVGRNGTRFVLLPKARGGGAASESAAPWLYVNGWNSYWLMGAAGSAEPRERARVREMMRRGREMGMDVCRTWAFSDGSGGGALQISPGRFDEQVFQALDYVIYEARRNHIRLILCLVNNLDAFGGKAQYVRWAKAAGANLTSLTDPFFSHPLIKSYYKGYIEAILRRKNSYSGIKYSDEPAIFAWELMNEPRCLSNTSAPLLQAWIAEMAAYIKTLDQKHLVTVGLEGFYGPKRTERLGTNPGEWAASLGSDFIQNSAVEAIDFASVHAYPDSWIPKARLEEKVKYLANWVDSHVNDSEYILKKPVLFTEIGSQLSVNKNGIYERDVFLKTVYDKIYRSAKKGQAGAGVLIWQLMIEGMQERYGDKFSLVARQHPSTFKLIKQQSCRLRYLLRKEETNKSLGWPCSTATP